ncbi:hypothetical protein EDB19DRAFT_898732 [Suillus lakei]|nr:hypothetical protein EDB19DRAFT_898732 [Suillus lakei]
MLARFFAVASLAALAVATPLSLRDGQCNTGDIQCCQSSTSTSTYNKAADLLGLVQVVAGVAGSVGLNCSPISAVGAGSGVECNQQQQDERPCQYWLHSHQPPPVNFR